MKTRVEVLREALERIRDDYGDVWGGSITLRETGEIFPQCMSCGEWAKDPKAIVHDEDCPVSISREALAAAAEAPLVVVVRIALSKETA